MVDQDSRGSAFSGDCDIAYALLVAGRVKYPPTHIDRNESCPSDLSSSHTLRVIHASLCSKALAA